MAIDFTTDAGRVRLLLNDVDEGNLVFKNEEIEAFLDLEDGSVKRAAAQAIDTNASNEVLASKVIKDHQLATDGAKAADALRKHAAALRAQAADEDGFFSLVPPGWPVTPELTERRYC